MYAVLLFLTLSLGLTKGAILPVSFDYDCSQVECATNTDSCPPDSIESEPAPSFDVLYGPEELMPPHDFYDEVEDLGDAVEQHFDELPMELSDVTALPFAANSTLGQLSDDRATKGLETEKGPELVLVKRQLYFDNGPTEAIGEHERMLQICCPTMTLESLQRRRRRRYSSVEDCKCKPCKPLPQCASGEVAVRVHEAKGVPGDCCPSYICTPKKECNDADVQQYWRDACTRCSCHGENGPELCHNECPMNEMGEIEIQRSCYASDSNEPMLHGSNWYENNWCTKCHCENGERECVGSLCMPTTCSNPVKIPGQCCPQCPVGVENILIAHENSIGTSKSSQADKELQSESTTTIAIILDNGTNTSSPEPSALATSTLTSLETSSESSTVLIAVEKQSTSSEEKTELTHPSSATTDISTTDVSASTTESTTTTRSIDDIASESYFGPVIHTSTEESSTSTHVVLDQTGEKTTQSILEPKSDISTSTSYLNSESTSTVEPTPTPAFASSTNETVSTETSTIELSKSTENSKEFSTTTSASVADNLSTTVAASYKEITTSTETSQETPLAIGNTESTTTTNFKPTESTTTELDSTSSTIGFSSTTSVGSTTTISTTSLVSVETSSTHLYSPSTSSPLPSTESPKTSTTFTTNSPYSSTAATQTVSTVISWYTFSTSAPSPPIPQPTVYQPSVRQFFTRPEVRYIGATVFVAFTVICALAVWKFCMPSRSERLKNHYRTVPSSEATSLSHISSTSHSSMA
uniref:VWFC domain-containing protein n=1 Tax=Bactrocera latifrons TaxID=174628 RepID=A0A0K8UH34_BACLA